MKMQKKLNNEQKWKKIYKNDIKLYGIKNYEKNVSFIKMRKLKKNAKKVKMRKKKCKKNVQRCTFLEKLGENAQKCQKKI